MNAESYIHSLFEIIGKVEITGIYGQDLEFNEGISRIIDMLKSQRSSGKKVIFLGNGGSAAIAEHGALDLWNNGKIRAVCFNEGAFLTCMGNDYGYPHVFEKPVTVFADPDDVLVAISSSGKSENVILAVEAARKQKCKVITLSGFSASNPLRKTGDVNLYVPSGSYGFVELAHQTAIHMIADIIMEDAGPGTLNG